MLLRVLPTSLALCAMLGGCASTTVEQTGQSPGSPLCQGSGERLTALVLWGPVWRPEQKEPALREEAARQGLVDFFATSGCFAAHELRRLPGGSSAAVPSDTELSALAAAASPKPDRVLVVIVHELGPIVKVLKSPGLVEGGTEVVLQLTALDAHMGELLARHRTHWRNGGDLVIKGVATLPQDMQEALAAALQPGPR